MSDFDKRLDKLQTRLEKMVEYQNYFYREITLLRDEIKVLKNFSPATEAAPQNELPRSQSAAENVAVAAAKPVFEKPPGPPRQPTPSSPSPSPRNASIPPPNVVPEKTSLEELIGRNLISIVGIIITIIGVGIGAKYAIDNDLISPLLRIVAGYAFGGALLGIALWLKQKYLGFSAVLLSGALAILYFITYFAYGFYGLLPQTLAFLLMLLITAATVVAAINYNRQIVAHIGLVGAYAVPFLLGGNSGNTGVLLGYVALINIGVLAVSLRKYWKPLFYSSFIFTWDVYAVAFLVNFESNVNFSLLLIFGGIFFLTFYLTFLAYKLVAKEPFGIETVLLLLINSFVFYGFGYALIGHQPGGRQFLGLFTIANAGLHFVVAALIKKYAFADKGSVGFLAALGLAFVTLAVPVELRGNWITLLWTAEATLLFWLGRSKKLPLYEYCGYGLMFLASCSLAKDWNLVFDNGYQTMPPFLNNNFLTAILFATGFGLIYLVQRKYPASIENPFRAAAGYAIPAIFLIVIYNAFRIEINHYFDLEIVRTSAINLSDGTTLRDSALDSLNLLWQLNYSMFFLTVLSAINSRKIKSDVLGLITLGLSVLVLFVFLTAGLFVLGELRESYLAQTNAEFFERGIFHILIRYISLAFVAALIVSADASLKTGLAHRFPKLYLKPAFDFVFYGSMLWLTSSELLNWAEIWRLDDADKLGLSVWWGIYSLILIVVGIVKRKKHLRVGAIFLFAFTLIKLFFYDIATLGTISKTIVFVSLGILLLVISFLYNKYKHLIFDEENLKPAATADDAQPAD